MSTTLSLSGLAASFGARPLFSDLTATIAPGDVVALVGPNGSGKSTLLRMVAGEHAPDAGQVLLSPPDATVGYLPQSVPDPAESILDHARGRTGVGRAQAAFERAADELASGAAGAEDRYARALDRWLALGGADLDVRLARTVADTGLDVDLQRPLGSLSGGQAARVSLATVLVTRFDVLALDEPTNNLDADGRAVLAHFVAAQRGPVLVASHDRDFLDRVATTVLELDIRQQAVNTYAGGWTDYRAARDLARRQSQQAYEAYAAQRNALVQRARQQEEWARRGRASMDRTVKERGTPRVDRKPAEDAAGRMEQRAARVRAAAERLTPVEQARKEWELRYSITEADPPAEVVLTLDRVVAAAGDFRVGPWSGQVARGDRILLAGPNGSGKSTLLAAVLGRRDPESGRLSWGTRTHVGVLDQERDLIAGPDALIDAVADALGTPDRAETRTLLAKFGLGAEHIGRPCDTLSLGERTRAALAVLQGRAVNVLVLDEPTNHLDVEAIEQLEGALATFGGTLMLVAHDAALVRAVGPTRVWRFTRDGAFATIREEHPPDGDR